MKTHVIVISYGYNSFLPGLISSLKWQSDPDFRLVLVTDKPQTSDSLNIVNIVPQEPFSRAMWRNIGLNQETIQGDDLCLFVDADMILSPNYIEDTKSEHSKNELLISYGRRKELPLEHNPKPENISKEWFLRYNDENPNWCLFWIRSCFCAIRAKHLRSLGGFPGYMVGWGSEDKAIHIQFIERLGGTYLVQMDCIALHQYHDSNINFEEDAYNYLQFLSRREELIKNNEWYLYDSRQNNLTFFGDWLVQEIEIKNLGIQIIGLNLTTGQNFLLSSTNGDWEKPFTGNCSIHELSLHDTNAKFFHIDPSSKKKILYEKSLVYIGDTPRRIETDENQFTA